MNNNELVTPVVFGENLVYIHHKMPRTGICTNGDHEITIDQHIHIICTHEYPNYGIIREDFSGLKTAKKEYIFPEKHCTIM